MKRTPLVLIGFAAGLVFGCTTAAVVADTPPTSDAPKQSAAAAEEGARAATAPVVINLSQVKARVAPSGKARASLLATGEQAFLGVLEMEGGAAVPEHRDPTEEFIYVLEGSGVITIDGVEHDVSPNTAIYMPAGAKVSFQNGDQRLVGVQVFADPGPEAKYDAWSAGE